MTTPDYDDPAVEKQWCADRRVDVARYLADESVAHGRVGEWPAWHLAPHVSVWAVESKVKPGWVGYWVICGDLPTDYLSADEIKHPRQALQAFAERWLAHCATVRSGAVDPETCIGDGPATPAELVELLQNRAEILADWARDDALWEGV